MIHISHRHQNMGPFLVITMMLFLFIGCQLDEQHSRRNRPNEQKSKVTTDVTVGGKVWNINPDLSYRATGVWTNPNPRPLTKAEKARMQEIKSKIQTFEKQLDDLDKELRYLERIELPQIKYRFRFGKPLYPVPKPSDFSTDKIIDLGEFPMKMELPDKIPSEE